MRTLEQVLQELHEAGKRVEISWLWDGGVEVKAGEEQRDFRSVAEVLPWLQHWYGLKSSGTSPDALETELQKIYDSEINVTIRIGGQKSLSLWGTTSLDSLRKGGIQNVRSPSLVPAGDPRTLLHLEV